MPASLIPQVVQNLQPEPQPVLQVPTPTVPENALVKDLPIGASIGADQKGSPDYQRQRVYNVVLDKDFATLNAADQKEVLSHYDPQFKQVSVSDIPDLINHIQANAKNRNLQVQGMHPVNTITGDNQDTQGLAEGVMTGATKGAAETGHTLGALAGKVLPDSVDNAVGLPTTLVQPDYLKSQSGSETVGKVLEGTAEFLLGDEALKGLTEAGRLKALTPVVALLEKSPRLASILSSVARTGALSGAQEFLHSGSTENVGQAAAMGGALGGATEGLVQGLGKGAEYLKSITPESKMADAEAQALAEQSDKLLNKNLTSQGAIDPLNEEAQKAVENITGSAPKAANSLDYTFNDAANDVRNHFDDVFNTLRTESKLPDGGNAFDIANNRIKMATKVLNNPSSVEAAESAQNVLTKANQQLDSIFSKSSLAPEQLSEARAAWRKAYTLEELGDGIDKAYTESQAVRKISGNLPEVDPSKIVSQINKTIGNIGQERLVDALGQDSAKQILDIREGMKKVVSSDKQLSELRNLAKDIYSKNPSPENQRNIEHYIGAGGLGLVAHLLGASNPVSAGVGTTAALVRFMYTHPTIGSKILSGLTKATEASVPVVKPVAAQAITHQFDPETGKLNPVQ